MQLIDSDFVTPQTKIVLLERIKKQERIADSFFDDTSFALLEAVCDCLLPQNERTEKIPLAVMLEEELHTSKGKGWRFDVLPPAKEAFTQGLKGIEEEAQQTCNTSFIQLSVSEQQNILKAVQTGTVRAGMWQQLPSHLFFTEILALLTELYYSHPLAKEEIGDASFTDAKGWQRIGLDELEEREPQPIKSATDEKE